jgi:hypothetical protein
MLLEDFTFPTIRTIECFFMALRESPLLREFTDSPIPLAVTLSMPALVLEVEYSMEDCIAQEESELHLHDFMLPTPSTIELSFFLGRIP